MQGSHARKIEFEVFIVTAEPVEKALPILRELEKSDLESFAVHLLCGAPEVGNRRCIDDAVRLSHFPGDSVFHLRSRIPALARDCEWLVILEDHNLIDASWPERVAVALGRTDPGVSAVIGACTNTRSTDAWSWANFLAVLGFHWAPAIGSPLEPVGFNVAFRRALLGTQELRLGEYETEIVPLAMQHARPDPSFPADHTQFRRFPEIVYYHWCNGRATGAFMREFTPAGMEQVKDHAHRTTFLRQRMLRDYLRTHPLRAELPRGTRLRVQLLAVAHSLGALYGGRFGAGRSLWALE